MTHHRYAAEGWGVGELWIEDGLLLLHELAGTFDAVAGVAVASRSATLNEPPGASLRRAQGGSGARAAFPPKGGAASPTGTLSTTPSRVADEIATDLCRRFSAHLAGVPMAYDDVAVDESGLSPFQRELLAALRGVSWGEVVSYGELAERAGRPRAARAAGTFCAGNQHALVVPCHRVVASDGIGGYGSTGVAVKRRLLALEGVTL